MLPAAQALKITLHLLQLCRRTTRERLTIAHDISKACVTVLTGCFYYDWVQSSQSNRSRNLHHCTEVKPVGAGGLHATPRC